MLDPAVNAEFATGAVMVATGGRPTLTVTGTESVDWPAAVAVTTAEYTPGLEYVWATLAPAPVVASPKFQLYVMASPFGSVAVGASVVTRGALPLAGVAEAEVICGGWFPEPTNRKR